MTKQEIKKAIDNGESVWGILESNELIEIVPSKIKVCDKKSFFYGEDYFMFMEDVYKTKAEAEHYLHHANVTRTETLPFLTWEEFKEEGSFDFYSENHEWFTLYWNDADGLVLENIISIDDKKTWDLTESNFYKAYDECVRLFRREE